MSEDTLKLKRSEITSRLAKCRAREPAGTGYPQPFVLQVFDPGGGAVLAQVQVAQVWKYKPAVGRPAKFGRIAMTFQCCQVHRWQLNQLYSMN